MGYDTPPINKLNSNLNITIPQIQYIRFYLKDNILGSGNNAVTSDNCSTDKGIITI